MIFKINSFSLKPKILTVYSKRITKKSHTVAGCEQAETLQSIDVSDIYSML